MEAVSHISHKLISAQEETIVLNLQLPFQIINQKIQEPILLPSTISEVLLLTIAI